MLLIDMGNTRMKWRRVSRAGVSEGSWSQFQGEWAKADCWSLLEPDEAVWIASVADANRKECLTRLGLQSTGKAPRFAIAEPMQSGVTNGYKDKARLGIDRWLAILAAWRECRQRCVVIDAGSALTVDLINERGEHEGGHIVPGLHMQMNVLLQATAQVRFDGRLARSLMPGRDTETAVTQGVMCMTTGYLRYLLQEAWQSGPEMPVVFLTGGDAEHLAPYVNLPVNVRKHLVLDGLGLYVQEHGF